MVNTPMKPELFNGDPVIVLDRESCGLPNFPSTPAIACKDFQAFLSLALSHGYKLTHTFTRKVGYADRTFMVFYLETLPKTRSKPAN